MRPKQGRLRSCQKLSLMKSHKSAQPPKNQCDKFQAKSTSCCCAAVHAHPDGRGGTWPASISFKAFKLWDKQLLPLPLLLLFCENEQENLSTHTPLGLKEHFKFSDLGDRGMATSGSGCLGPVDNHCQREGERGSEKARNEIDSVQIWG